MSIHQKQIKQDNQKRIFSLIWHEGPISQVQIAGSLDLRPSTISNLMRSFKDAQFVRFWGKGHSSSIGGKREELLVINEEYAFFAGLAIRPNKIIRSTLDFQGKIRSTKTLRIDTNHPGQIPGTIAEEINRLIKDYPALKGIGISVSSVISERGDILVSEDFDWQLPNFTREVEKLLPPEFPFIVENDANCAAYYAYTFFRGEYKNLLTFLLTGNPDSAGAGIFFDGKLYRGARGAAGELFRERGEDSLSAAIRNAVTAYLLLDPEVIVVVNERSKNKEKTTKIFTEKLSGALSPAGIPIRVLGEQGIPILGSAYMIMHKVMQQFVEKELV